MKRGNCCDTVHSLLSLDEAKVLLGTDDREDSLLEFLLVSSTYAIEEYCMHRLLRKRVKECFVDTPEPVFPLKEYLVMDVSVVECVNVYGAAAKPLLFDLSPEAGALVNVSYTLRLVHARGLVSASGLGGGSE
jgi:hypothetical protein